MNVVILDGQIADAPRMISNHPPHLVFALKLPCREGPKPYILCPISAWNLTAIWGARNLCEGQYVRVEGYISQWHKTDMTLDLITARRLSLLGQ